MKFFTVNARVVRFLSYVSALIALGLLVMGVAGIIEAKHLLTGPEIVVVHDHDHDRDHGSSSDEGGRHGGSAVSAPPSKSAAARAVDEAGHALQTTSGAQLMLLSIYMIIASTLILVGETRRPVFVLKQCFYLHSYLGRGLLHLVVGGSLLLIGRHSLWASVAGLSALVIAGFDLLIACPCCVAEDTYDALDEISPPPSPDVFGSGSGGGGGGGRRGGGGGGPFEDDSLLFPGHGSGKKNRKHYDGTGATGYQYGYTYDTNAQLSP